MTGFFRRRPGLGQELRDARARPSEPLVRSIESRFEAARSRPPRRLLRLAPAVAFTAILAGGLAATGGLGYAASGVEHVAGSVSRVLAADHPQRAGSARQLSSGHDQYRPGYGWGDPNHTHTGPPGLNKKSGHPKGKQKGRFTFVTVKINVDEQADLYFSVTSGKAKRGKALLIVQKRSHVGQGVKGRPTKKLHYRMLIPRTILVRLAIPSRMLHHGQRYYIHVLARSPAPYHRTAQLWIPFTP